MRIMQLESRAALIDVLMVIDTEYVKAHHANPSHNPNKPTRIAHHSQHMICGGARSKPRGQGTAELSFQAIPGDAVSFHAVSIYGNSDDVIIVYGIDYGKGDQVFNHFVPNLINRKRATLPNIDTDNGLPPIAANMNFISMDSRIRQPGTENLQAYLALYTLTDDNEMQRLHGYYVWDPTVEVSWTT